MTMTIPLSRGFVALVDDDIHPHLSKMKWSANKNWGTRYAVCRPTHRGKISMHWMVLGRKPENGFVVDHINGNGLDNRRENLRIVSIRENGWNRKEHRSGRLVGACLKKGSTRWQSSIVINGKKKYLGYFDTELAAHEAYKAEAQKLSSEGKK